jgi:hypothetical protein
MFATLPKLIPTQMKLSRQDICDHARDPIPLTTLVPSFWPTWQKWESKLTLVWRHLGKSSMPTMYVLVQFDHLSQTWLNIRSGRLNGRLLYGYKMAYNSILGQKFVWNLNGSCIRNVSFPIVYYITHGRLQIFSRGLKHSLIKFYYQIYFWCWHFTAF